MEQKTKTYLLNLKEKDIIDLLRTSLEEKTQIPLLTAGGKYYADCILCPRQERKRNNSFSLNHYFHYLGD